MKIIFILFSFLVFVSCINEPADIQPKLIIYANSSVAEYLPLHIYMDGSFVGSLQATVSPFDGDIPSKNDEALLHINVDPGTYDILVISLPVAVDTAIDYTILDNIQNDFSIRPTFRSSREITVQEDQHVYQGIGD